MEFDQLRQPVVLVIEDHDALRLALCEWIGKSFCRSRVRDACNVEDGLRIIDAESVDIVLMDIQLPGMNGIDGARACLQRSPRTTIVMVSNYDDTSHRAAAAQAGVTAFVPKRTIGKELSPVLRDLMVHAVFAKNPELTTWVNG